MQDWEPVIWKKEDKLKPVPYENEPAVLQMNFSIQKAIQQARIACKMTQKELATKLQINISQINDYENGKIVPTNLFISKLEKALNTKLPRASKKKIIVDI